MTRVLKETKERDPWVSAKQTKRFREPVEFRGPGEPWGYLPLRFHAGSSGEGAERGADETCFNKTRSFFPQNIFSQDLGNPDTDVMSLQPRSPHYSLPLSTPGFLP